MHLTSWQRYSCWQGVMEHATRGTEPPNYLPTAPPYSAPAPNTASCGALRCKSTGSCRRSLKSIDALQQAQPLSTSFPPHNTSVDCVRACVSVCVGLPLSISQSVSTLTSVLAVINSLHTYTTLSSSCLEREACHEESSGSFPLLACCRREGRDNI